VGVQFQCQWVKLRSVTMKWNIIKKQLCLTKCAMFTLFTDTDVRHPWQLACNPLCSMWWKTKDTLGKVTYIFPFTCIHVSTTQGTKDIHKQYHCSHAYKRIENILWTISTHLMKKVKCSRYRPRVAQRVGRGIALLFHDRGTRRGWVVSSTPRPNFTTGKDPVPILHEAGWAPGPVWMGRKSHPHQDSIPDRPAHSQSLYQLSYPAHNSTYVSRLYWSHQGGIF